MKNNKKIFKEKFLLGLKKYILVFTASAIFITTAISLYSYSDLDPSPFNVTDLDILNILGKYGATISAILKFVYGESVWLLIIFQFFLIRLIIVANISLKSFLFRTFIFALCLLVISISLQKFEGATGIFGKLLITKTLSLSSFFKMYQNYISPITLVLFGLISFISISKNLMSFLSGIRSFFKFLFKIIMFTFSFIRGNSSLLNNRLKRKSNLNKKPTLQKNKIQSNYIFPHVDFLAEGVSQKKNYNGNINEQSKNLEKVLEDYGIKGEIINVKIGPVVTRYELEPAPGTRSSRVISLSDDIARSMSAKSARVAVVYGKNAIGIELPNKNIEVVSLKDIFSSSAFLNEDGLILALGKDIAGKSIVTNLSKMPHLLIAGTTGSGKSVSINAMILSLLYKFSPEDCKFIMIDPKMLELSVYEGIPHLLHPVVTDPRKAIHALKWAVREMNDRYKQMTLLGVRNIESFNNIIQKKTYKDNKFIKKVQVGYDEVSGKPVYQQKEVTLKSLPFLVIIVDEMADLMLAAGKDIEISIQSLAQKARAAGIHLVLATQRPSVDVITGTIKANLPYRISFQVTSRIDSRTILGEQGAEQLLGKGDMLFMAGGGITERIHGPYVSDQEISKVTNFIRSQGAPEYKHHITENKDEDNSEKNENTEEQDPLYNKALTMILKEQKISTSLIQRHFAIGYNRAARIVDLMEKRGIVSGPNSMGRREILIDR